MYIKAKKIILFISVALLSFTSLNISASQQAVEGTRGYVDERHKAVAPYNGPSRSGERVYREACATCHDRTTQGAPLPDDDVEWGNRIKKGKDTLLKHVMQGYKELMPVKGGCGNCTEKELLAAINYILQTSGVEK